MLRYILLGVVLLLAVDVGRGLYMYSLLFNKHLLEKSVYELPTNSSKNIVLFVGDEKDIDHWVPEQGYKLTWTSNAQLYPKIYQILQAQNNVDKQKTYSVLNVPNDLSTQPFLLLEIENLANLKQNKGRITFTNKHPNFLVRLLQGNFMILQVGTTYTREGPDALEKEILNYYENIHRQQPNTSKLCSINIDTVNTQNSYFKILSAECNPTESLVVELKKETHIVGEQNLKRWLQGLGITLLDNQIKYVVN
ncbi:MAG: hypothetical protein R3B92_00370 [Patescibacteria group bacterium]|uniref:Uncharacterized protein n=1 Tax=candidate division WWE3 bacterium TaxID=2053526 RepID=A0A955EDM7_UNCKA|nr:hypothetical protein [candidate division WWE3 bacterium]